MIFYNLSNACKRGAIEILTDQEFSPCKHISDDSPIIIYNKFVIDSGKKWYDVIGFADSHIHFAISKKFKILLEHNNIKGWKCFPIKIEGTNEEYFVFQITSVAGEILNKKELNSFKENLKFDINTWDGSGIFTLKETALILCTQYVKDILEKNKISNIEFDQL